MQTTQDERPQNLLNANLVTDAWGSIRRNFGKSVPGRDTVPFEDEIMCSGLRCGAAAAPLRSGVPNIGVRTASAENENVPPIKDLIR